MEPTDRQEALKWLKPANETYGAAGVSVMARAMGLTRQSDRAGECQDVEPFDELVPLPLPSGEGDEKDAPYGSSAISTYWFRHGPVAEPKRERLPLACPKAPPRGNQGWKPYDGDPWWFHCDYEGYLENREPSPELPAGERFYDENGALVDESHRYSRCSGTLNDYASSDIWHFFPDRGGIARHGLAGSWESRAREGDQARDAMRREMMRLGFPPYSIGPFRAPLPR